MTTTHPTTPDQGDERRAFEAYCMRNGGNRPINWDEAHTLQEVPDALKGKYIINSVQQAWEAWQAARALSAAQPVAQEAIPPIERDESMDRTYIPLPGGWEVQTQGKGSTFRICNTKTGKRWPVLDKMLHTALEQMARDANASALAASHPSQGIDYHAPERIKAWNNAAPHPPVSAEAGKGVEDSVAYRYACTLAQSIFDSEYASDPDYASGRVKWGLCDSTAGVLTQIDNMVSGMTRKRPSESVAVSGEVSDTLALLVECRDAFPVPPPGSPLEQAWAQAMGEPECIPDYLRAAVLALAGSARQASALERMARLDDEMGIEP